ncbi:hypothetical protein QBC45DRAFT_109192 [Copromyces sp. CBS 386.78]|nr:hypothetical protein QBC45DRAFT_109192 [Copromyces sp. CBS 386.78]
MVEWLFAHCFCHTLAISYFLFLSCFLQPIGTFTQYPSPLAYGSLDQLLFFFVFFYVDKAR